MKKSFSDNDDSDEENKVTRKKKTDAKVDNFNFVIVICKK